MTYSPCPSSTCSSSRTKRRICSRSISRSSGVKFSIYSVMLRPRAPIKSISLSPDWELIPLATSHVLSRQSLSFFLWFDLENISALNVSVMTLTLRFFFFFFFLPLLSLSFFFFLSFLFLAGLPSFARLVYCFWTPIPRSWALRSSGMRPSAFSYKNM